MPSRQKKIELLETAQEKLVECIEILEDAVGDNANAVAYLIDQLKIHATADHGYLSNSLNIDTLIEVYQNGDE